MDRLSVSVPPDPDRVAALTVGTFAAFDFETATDERASACALGVVTVDDGQLTDAQSWLIQPPNNEYSAFNTYLHGIGPIDTANAPEFTDVFNEAHEYIAGRPVVAHNAAFDVGVVRAEHARTGRTLPEMTTACTFVMSRRAWRGLTSYSLPVVADFLGLGSFTHHDAIADAQVSAYIALHLIDAAGVASLHDAADAFGVRLGSLHADRYEPCRAKSVDGGRAAWGFSEPDPADLDPDHPFAGAKVAFTGTLSSMTRWEAAQRVVSAGGEFTTSVSRFTSYVVFGEQDFSKFVDGEKSNKTRRAEAIVAAGHHLQIVSEDDFHRMLG